MPLMRNRPGYDPTSTMSAKTKKMLGVEEGVRDAAVSTAPSKGAVETGQENVTLSQPVAPAPTPASLSLPTEELKKELAAVKEEEVKLEKEIANGKEVDTGSNQAAGSTSQGIGSTTGTENSGEQASKSSKK